MFHALVWYGIGLELLVIASMEWTQANKPYRWQGDTLKPPARLMLPDELRINQGVDVISGGTFYSTDPETRRLLKERGMLAEPPPAKNK